MVRKTEIDILQNEVQKRLAVYGISSEDIDWRTGFSIDGDYPYMRYGYWKHLPSDAYDAISPLMYEDCYEDDDGDDDRGRPIIRRLYSYKFINH
jgi:hypothetical protein